MADIMPLRLMSKLNNRFSQSYNPPEADVRISKIRGCPISSRIAPVGVYKTSSVPPSCEFYDLPIFSKPLQTSSLPPGSPPLLPPSLPAFDPSLCWAKLGQALLPVATSLRHGFDLKLPDVSCVAWRTCSNWSHSFFGEKSVRLVAIHQSVPIFFDNFGQAHQILNWHAWFAGIQQLCKVLFGYHRFACRKAQEANGTQIANWR